MKVLIIEPDPIAIIITERLVSFYYNPSVCSTEEEAIALLQDCFFSVILVAIDHNTEIKSKIDFLKKIKSHRIRSFKVFALCLFADDQARDELLKGGYAGVLQKPFRIQELNALI